MAMADQELVRFLQKILPDLGLRWAGIRKVRKTVAKRIARRIRDLRLSGLDGYEQHVSADQAEAQLLDTLCRIPISRFFRDREVFRLLESQVLPACARDAVDLGRDEIRCLSAGCASGEEPYSVNLVWLCRVARRYPTLRLSILAIDAEPDMLRRASQGSYKASSLKEVPEDIRAMAFDEVGDAYRLRAEFRSGVRFQRCDIRETMPDGPFDVILCRNLAFTYFADPVQAVVLEDLDHRLRPGGFLIIGNHESLPQASGYAATAGHGVHVPIFRKTDRGFVEADHGEDQFERRTAADLGPTDPKEGSQCNIVLEANSSSTEATEKAGARSSEQRSASPSSPGRRSD